MIIGFISKLVRTITLGRVAVWTLTALLCISLYTMYENRSRIVSLFAAPEITTLMGTTFRVGQESQMRLTDIVKNDETIIGIAVMGADLRLNEARSMFFSGDEPTLVSVDAAASRADSNRLPLFTSVDESNAEIIKLINGQFSCIPFENTLRAKIYPELKGSVKMVCHSSIPSYYGYFSGYLEVFLNTVPSPERQLQLKLVIEKLANDVYFKDVLATQRSEPILQRSSPATP